MFAAIMLKIAANYVAARDEQRLYPDKINLPRAAMPAAEMSIFLNNR